MRIYSDYQTINLPWLTAIPAHWCIDRLKNLLYERKENNKPIKTRGILSLTNTRGVIPYSQKGNIGNRSKENLEDYHLAYPNDLVLNSMNVIIGSVGVSSYYGAISPVYYALVSRGTISIKYCEYIFRLPTFEESLKGLGNGILEIRRRIPMTRLNNVALPIPPREEQDQIVRFLDWKVSEINRLINIKHQNIRTLKELMQAEIEKQLAAFDIVETVRLKQIGTFYKGGGFSRDNLVDDTSCPAILYGDIYTQYDYKTSHITHYVDAEAYAASRKISKGDIVMAGTGETKDEIGKSILYTGEEIVAVGGDVIVFHPHDSINAEYVLYQLYSHASLKHRYIHGKGDIIVHIYPTALGNTIIHLPSSEDQKTAILAINNIIESVNQTISTLEQEITVLKEFSVRMVADVVTGKIDVRGIEIPEYEYTAEEADTDSEAEAEELDEGGEEI